MIAVFDSNIVIDFLNGIEQARAAIDRALFKLRPVEPRGAVAEFRAAR